MTFGRLKCELYAFDIRKSKSFSMINTISENEQLFTLRQVNRAKAARNLYEMIGFPSMNNYISVV